MTDASLEDFVQQSRRMCEEAGMDPAEIRIPKEKMSAEELAGKRDEYNEILEVVDFFAKKVLHSLAGTPVLIVISDERGYILKIDGDETIRSTVQQLGIETGVRFTQEDLGTNVISLALQQEHPVALIGDDHYFEFLHGSACYSAPFHYTDLDNLLGTVSIMTGIQLENSLFLNMLMNVVDSIERELLLRKQNRRLNILNQIMLQRTRNAVIITDTEGTVTEYNDFAENLSGFKREEIIGRDIFKSDITGDYFYQVLRHEKQFKDVEMKFINNLNNEHICLFDAQPIYDVKNAKIIGAFAQLRDITERYQLQEQYNYLAYHDELTTLPNRRYFQSELENLIAEGAAGTALLLIDLDGFKNINDTFGHSNGDKLLQSVAKRLQTCVDSSQLLARISGDEFMVLLTDVTSETSVSQFAKHLLDQFQQPFYLGERSFYMTASIGAAVYEEAPPSLEDYMVHVDAAMYKAKSQGKNDYRMFSPEMYVNSSDELLLENDLRAAVRNNELRLFYQPLVETDTGRISGFEALIRWQHPERGMLSPSAFIPLAEKTGLIIPIGDWVIQEACRQHMQWLSEGLPPLKISLNLSAQQFLKQDFTEFTADVISRSGIDPRYLDFEITESMAMDFNYAASVLEELKGLGLSISMDDFGTGYSSLFYLKQFRIDTLKIDKFFVDDLAAGSNGAALIKTIIAMAGALELHVTAEGVEEWCQFKTLRDLGCTYIQGYYFMEPISPDTISASYYEMQKRIEEKTAG